MVVVREGTGGPGADRRGEGVLSERQREEALGVGLVALGILLALSVLSPVLIGEGRIPANALTSFLGQIVAVPTQMAVVTFGFENVLTKKITTCVRHHLKYMGKVSSLIFVLFLTL